MLERCEVIFFFIFLTEMLLNWAVMGGLKFYFAEPFKILDFVLVLSSIPQVAAAMGSGGTSINFSMLRVMKMLRLLKFLPETQQLIMIVASAIKPMLNLLLFISFVTILFGIFGMQMFSQKLCNVDLVDDVCAVYPRTNFDTILYALQALFQVMTGEQWSNIMWTILFQYPWFGIIFMCSFFVMANYILMEMFNAVILENFQLGTQQKLVLQRELVDIKLAKIAQAKNLAESIDKEMVKLKEEEQRIADAEAKRVRDRAIREQNEAARNVGTADSSKSMTPEEKQKQEEEKKERDIKLRQKNGGRVATCEWGWGAN